MNDEPTPAVRATRCTADGRACEHVIALAREGHVALYVTDCPEQGRALLDHAARLAQTHLDEANLYNQPERNDS